MGYSELMEYKLRRQIAELRGQLRKLRLSKRSEMPAERDIPPALGDFSDALRLCHFSHYPPCVYFLCLGDRVVYIGQSISLLRRLADHVERFTFDRVLYIAVDAYRSPTLDQVETAFIRHLDPELNRSGGIRLDDIQRVLKPFRNPIAVKSSGDIREPETANA